MITLYGYTILADLALLAVTVAIFIFAVTIYKGAFELCIKEKESASNRSKEIFTQRKGELTNKLKTLTNVASLNEVRAEIERLENEIKNIDKSVKKTIDKSKNLTARNLIFYPGSLIIISIITSGVAIGTSGITPTIMWVISLLLLATSLYFICRGICAIEFFSNFIDLSTLMEQALGRHTDKLKPAVDMAFFDSTITIEHRKTEEVEYYVFLRKGSIGRNTEIRFSATEELDFPEEETSSFDFNKKNMTNPKWFTHEIGDVNPEVNKTKQFKIKAPDTPGKYFMSYWIQCDEFTREEEYFTIKVI
ncbi:hypothetical protein ES703_89789 [subsurface metagenome]